MGITSRARQDTSASDAMKISHLFIDCPTYTTERTPLQDRCHALNIPYSLDDVISSDIPTYMLAEFLQATEILYKL